MGASNCPETPRQRMIGMMYLVLTAMLALNVSKDIINAFVVVDDTLVVANQNAEKNVEENYSFVDRQAAILGPEKIGDTPARAAALKKATADLVDYINQTRIELLRVADESELTEDGRVKTAKDIEKKDNTSNASNFFINNGRAEQLKNEIIKYKATILELVKPENRDQVKEYIGLDVEGTYYNNDDDKETWEKHNFDGMILIAGVTMMNKLIGEVKNAESAVLAHIATGIGAEDFKFDHIGGRSIPKSELVFQGENYEADIIVAAYDSKQNPKVYYKMGVDTLPENQRESAIELEGDKGVVKLQLAGSSIGDFKYAGFIMVNKPDGTPGYYHFSNKYTVMKPTATVAAERMNVLYAGIENPLSVSASVPQERLSLSIPGCNTPKTATGWNAVVPANLVGREVVATVTANLDGKNQTMGSTKFRVKRVPDPYAVIGADIRGGRKSKQDLLANPALLAKMGEDFVYDLRWKVLSYRVLFVIKGIEEAPIIVNGPAFNDQLRNKINSAPAGTTIFFTDIRVQSPAGDRSLQEISIRLR
ncbi:gliding motility protein GldM [Bacteroidales bacterium OttesenSCG-928-B11]|nr:gliding motility protein GldM [Bacteroidales bacterium OttesenSCG-928-C03]MDL2311708.1 gliding motility protein GldM [Bacteroidales bacterium OttesenSCG-928-B11]MDL2325901.1 gliding motility protein GldM [Bacteroidales bacterium OttesenSCG-928-A14]